MNETVVDLTPEQGKRLEEQIVRFALDKAKRKFDVEIQQAEQQVTIKGQHEDDVELVASIVSTIAGDNADSSVLTVVETPENLVGYVTGKGGGSIQKMEDEFGCFIIHYKGSFYLFGSRKSRMGASFRVKCLVEQFEKAYSKDIKEERPEGDYVTTYLKLLSPENTNQLSILRKRMISDASGCIVDQVGPYLCLWGTVEERELAEFYGSKYLTDKIPTLTLDEARQRLDAFILQIPVQLRDVWQVEERTGTCCVEIEDDGNYYIAILASSMKSRMRAKLYIMGVVEEKNPGEYTKGVENSKSPDTWGEDTFVLEAEERRYVKDRNEVAERASGCLIRLVGNVVFFVGSSEERECGRRYIKWILQLRVGPLVLSSEDSQLSVLKGSYRKDIMSSDFNDALKRLEKVHKCFVFYAHDASYRYARRIFVAGSDPHHRSLCLHELRWIRPDKPIQRKSENHHKRSSENHGSYRESFKRPRH
eukprot:TRINITY_DN3835_c0_g3_i1.p1 TRINITY_DN3835_c0_g3~~TRINITY_DN3835_c0_g3_i1.p1  ORF type:complete len:477 (+),score=106.20 TRINITY_DN3835_c0_g3_i1:45-1475(+)